MSEPMHVVRVQDDTGTHIEPALDQTWDEVTKLRWHAAVVAHDTGLRIELHPHLGEDGHYQYGVNIGEIDGGGLSSFNVGAYLDAWYALTHISIGAESVRRAIAHEERP
jgi:hypothetical protein